MLSVGSHSALTRTGCVYCRPSLRAWNASSWNVSSSSVVNGGGVRGRSPRRTRRSHDARSSARAAKTPKDAAACVSPKKNVCRRRAVETACACVTICESTPSVTGLVAAAKRAGSPSAAARFRALAARRASARSMPAMDAQTARAVSLATRDGFFLKSAGSEPGGAASRHLRIARAHVLTSASSVFTLETMRGSRANDATVSDAARRTSSFAASAASLTSAPKPPDLMARLRQSPSRINVEASARAAAARRPACVSETRGVPPGATRGSTPHARTSAEKDGSARAYAARNDVSTARTPKAPTACSKSATASEGSRETGAGAAGAGPAGAGPAGSDDSGGAGSAADADASAADSSPPALVSPASAEDAASAAGGSVATGVSSGSGASPTLSARFSSAKARFAVSAAVSASSVSSRSSAALAASSSETADAITAPPSPASSSALLNPFAASKPARPRADTARLQAAASAYRRAAGVTMPSSASMSPTTASNASGARWKSSAPRARASVAISHSPCAAASTSSLVMVLALSSARPSGSPPLEHHSAARRASARSVSRLATSHGSGPAAATAAHAAASFTSSLGAPDAGTSGS